MPLKYKVVFAQNATTVQLSGNVDEHVADVLDEIRPQMRTPRVIMDLEHLGHINSIGVSLWLAHIAAFGDLELHFAHCPHSFSSLCLIVPDLVGGGTVDSLYARYHCRSCKGEPQMCLVQRDAALAAGRLDEQPCPRCRTPMAPEEDDLEFIEVLRGQAQD